MGFLRRIIKRFTKPRCNVCGGQKFGRGPNERLSPTGKPPRCKRCQSLERHRAFRRIFLELGPRRLRSLRCLQFSPDPTVNRRWFDRYEVSVFGTSSSLDLQRIDRPDHSYDVVVCNHVLEHVPDYRAALRELSRILNARGFLFLSFPDPSRAERTVDWGYPDPNLHNHYRHFGRDIEAVFRQEMPDCQVVAITAVDTVTGTRDLAYVVTRSSDWLRRFGGLKLDARVCAQPAPAG
jgi:predicted SAM-dependent methyltransferase